MTFCERTNCDHNSKEEFEGDNYCMLNCMAIDENGYCVNADIDEDEE